MKDQEESEVPVKQMDPSEPNTLNTHTLIKVKTLICETTSQSHKGDLSCQSRLTHFKGVTRKVPWKNPSEIKWNNTKIDLHHATHMENIVKHDEIKTLMTSVSQDTKVIN